MRTNVRLMARDWKSASALQRYFMVSQLVSGFLLGFLSLLSVAALFVGERDASLGLLAVAALCFAHTLATWGVLRKRFKVRYEVF